VTADLHAVFGPQMEEAGNGSGDSSSSIRSAPKLPMKVSDPEVTGLMPKRVFRDF